MKTTVTKGITAEPVTREQLQKINLFTRRELTEEEVYTFTVTLCDNEIDRDGEQFPPESLEALGELFIGKTGVFDHDPKAENQSARIFETKVIREGGENSLGEPCCHLKAWAYMVRCEKNTDLILEIEAGIKKEVSVSCSVERIVCSVCGRDQKKEVCRHRKGEEYDGVTCWYKLLNPTDAYEWSFVAVPAQKNAGVTRKEAHVERGLKKFFEESGEIPLSQTEKEALKAQYAELEMLAEAGKMYLNGLRGDVVKRAALTRPKISGAVMEAVAKKLTIPELLEMKKAFDEPEYTGAPQLSGKDREGWENAGSAFKI